MSAATMATILYQIVSGPASAAEERAHACAFPSAEERAHARPYCRGRCDSQNGVGPTIVSASAISVITRRVVRAVVSILRARPVVRARGDISRPPATALIS